MEASWLPNIRIASLPVSMATRSRKVMSLASADTELYHFCFYQLMVRLDDRLAVGGPLMTEVATNFIDGMKALWILAGGLDALSGQQHYFDYLRARYVQISKDVFGRDVVVVGPPMGGVIDPAFMTKAMAKPAGPAPAP